jgi:hypothetical protein
MGQWLLLIFYSLMALANAIRGAGAWALRFVVPETSLSLPVIGTVYLVLGTLFMVAGIIYFRTPVRRSRALARGLAVGYQIIVWAIHLLGDQSAYAQRLWGRHLILSLVFLALVFWFTEMNVRRRR